LRQDLLVGLTDTLGAEVQANPENSIHAIGGTLLVAGAQARGQEMLERGGVVDLSEEKNSCWGADRPSRRWTCGGVSAVRGG